MLVVSGAGPAWTTLATCGVPWPCTHNRWALGPSQGLDQQQDHAQTPLSVHWDPPVTGGDCHQDPLVLPWEPWSLLQGLDGHQDPLLVS